MQRRQKIVIAVLIALFVLATTLLFMFGRRNGQTGLPTAVPETRNWYGFFYPDFKVPQTPDEKRAALQNAHRFATFEDCQVWGSNATGGNNFFPAYGADMTDPDVAANIPPEANSGYNCGLNCRFDESLKDIVCDQKI